MSPEPENEPKKEGLPKSGLRTMVGDAQAYIKDKSFSLAELVSQKKEQSAAFEEKRSVSYLKVSGFVLAVILIISLAGAGIYWAVRTLNGPAPEPEAPKSLIPAEKEISIEVSSIRETDSFLNEWKNLFNLQLLPRGFGHVTIFSEEENKFIDSTGFFRLMRANPPALLAENLGERATVGLADTPRGTEPLFIFEIKSFSSAFAGMLEWEKSLPKNIEKFLSNRMSLDRGENVFQDVIIANNDARFLYNRDREPILGYSIFNRRFLIIAQSQTAVEIAVKQLSLFPPK